VTKYVALLRGINVGGHRKVPMADLRGLLERLGYDDVATLLQSGNVVFEAPERPTGELIPILETAIAEEFGFEVPVMVRTGAELRAVVAANPLEVRDPARLAVAFLGGTLDPRVWAAIEPERYAPEELWAGERELYMYFPDGLGKARFDPSLLARRDGPRATVRNWNTVTRLAAMTGGDGDEPAPAPRRV